MVKLFAGTDKVNITNPSPATPVMDPLYAKVLTLDDGSEKFVLITMDTTSIGGRRISDGILYDVSEEFLPCLRKRIEAELNIPGLNVMVNASHTHPPGRLLCDDDELFERVYGAVNRAAHNMTEVKIGAGSGIEDRIAMNRTLRLKDGSHWTVRHTNPSPPEEEIAGYGPVDHEVGVLRIDRVDGSPLAVVYNFACHLLFGDALGSITGNFPAYASKRIEETLGHDSMAFFVQGAAGDINDKGFKDFTRTRDIKPFGAILGQTVLNIRNDIKCETQKIKVVSKSIKVPRRADIPEKIAALKREQKELLESLIGTTLNLEMFLCLRDILTADPDMDAFNKANTDKYQKNIRAMEKLARIGDKISTLEKHRKINIESGEETIDMELQTVKIGDCIIAASPAELLTEVGLNVKKSSPYKYTFVVGYSNGYVHYGAPAVYYDKGGYEVTECLLAPEWQYIFEQKSNEIIKQL